MSSLDDDDVTARAKELIATGATNDEIWAVLKEEFDLDDEDDDLLALLLNFGPGVLANFGPPPVP